MILPHAMRETDKVVFLHIPKTAGTSVNHYFRNLVGGANVGWLGIDFGPQELAAGTTCLDNFKVIGGHFTRQQAQSIPGDKTYLSIVRNPVERVISYHHHMMQSREDREASQMTGNMAADLRGRFGQHIRNQQCFFLGLGTDRGAAYSLVDDGRIGITTPECAEALLSFVAERIGLPTHELPRENDSKREYPALSEATMDAMRGLISEDSLLYGRLRHMQEEPYAASYSPDTRMTRPSDAGYVPS